MRCHIMLLSLVPCVIQANTIIRFQGEISTPTCVINHHQLSNSLKNTHNLCYQDLTLKITPVTKNIPIKENIQNAKQPNIDNTLKLVRIVYN